MSYWKLSNLCRLIFLLLLLCNFVVVHVTVIQMNNNKITQLQQQWKKNINPDISYWRLSNLCRMIFLLLLLLLLCNCVVTTTTKLYIKHMLMCNFVVATTKLHIKNKNKMINLHTFSVQLSITQLRRQITGRHTYVRCTPQ